MKAVTRFSTGISVMIWRTKRIGRTVSQGVRISPARMPTSEKMNEVRSDGSPNEAAAFTPSRPLRSINTIIPMMREMKSADMDLDSSAHLPRGSQMKGGEKDVSRGTKVALTAGKVNRNN